MKIKSLFAAALALLTLAGCDQVKENDRYVAVEGEISSTRVVLLEDFTGQRCTNCPNAHRTVQQIKERYGHQVVCVSIGSGALGIAFPRGLKTQQGEKYAVAAGITTWPSGIVNRATSPLDYGDWMGSVKTALKNDPKVLLSLDARIADGKVSVSAEMDPKENINGSLQLWLVQNDVIASQLDNGTEIADYSHQDVFRACINGQNGETVSLVAGEKKTMTGELAIDSRWTGGDFVVVGLVYDGTGVLQAAEVHAR